MQDEVATPRSAEAVESPINPFAAAPVNGFAGRYEAAPVLPLSRQPTEPQTQTIDEPTAPPVSQDESVITPPRRRCGPRAGAVDGQPAARRVAQFDDERRPDD